MKKIIGILGMAVIVMTVFFNVSLLANDDLNTNLITLSSIAKANAQNGESGGGNCTYTSKQSKLVTGTNTWQVVGYNGEILETCTQQYSYNQEICGGTNGSICCDGGVSNYTETDPECS